MTDADALLATILAHPVDDLPRLVYADFIEEGGDAARAEFIRIQCELAKWENCTLQYFSTQVMGELQSKMSRLEGGNNTHELRQRAHPIASQRLRDHLDQKDDLKRRERELFGDYSDRWFPSLICANNSEVSYSPANGEWHIVRRGFVESVRLPLAAFMGGECGNCGGEGGLRDEWPCKRCSGAGRTEGIAKRLFESQPVTRVEFTDREPYSGHGGDASGGFWWVISPMLQYGSQVFDRNTIPAELWFYVSRGEPGRRFANTYKTREDALAALSIAAVAYGRSLANPRTLDPVA